MTRLDDSRSKNTRKLTKRRGSTPLTYQQTVINTYKNHRRSIKKLGERLTQATALDVESQKDFQNVYKEIFLLSNNKRYPAWVKFYDLLFIGNERGIIISNRNTGVGHILDVNELFKSDITFNLLRTLFFKLEFTINHLIKLYNEGKNYNYFFKDSIKDLKNWGLINNNLYNKLILLADLRARIIRAHRLKDVRLNKQVTKLVNQSNEFKIMFCEAYIEILQIYTTIQTPYLKKFSVLLAANQLRFNGLTSFYIL